MPGQQPPFHLPGRTDPTRDTLTLPRILCLHGGGTNARIFRMQCRVLESALQSTFRLVYAEAPFASQPESSVTSVYRNYGPFKGWLLPGQERSGVGAKYVTDRIQRALSTAMMADDARGATGEWIAILGFSQGAKIAASILFAQPRGHDVPVQEAGRFLWPDFRFGALLAGRGPIVWLMPELEMPQGLIDAASPALSMAEPPLASGKRLVDIPTIHVHGMRDPGLELHRKLLQRYCDSRCVAVLEWDGDHRVPIKTKDVNALVERIYMMARKTGCA